MRHLNRDFTKKDICMASTVHEKMLSITGRCCCLATKSCSTLCDLTTSCKPARLCSPWDFPGKNTGRGCHFLFQEIILTQGSNSCLLHWQMGSAHQGSPTGH